MQGLTREVWQFVDGSAGKKYDECAEGRCDISVFDEGFMRVKVSGKKVTVNYFNKDGPVSSSEVTFTK